MSLAQNMLTDEEFANLDGLSRNVEFSEPLQNTHDGLRGFELKDADGYVLFLGRTINGAKH